MSPVFAINRNRAQSLSEVKIMSCLGASGYTKSSGSLALTIPSHTSPESSVVDTFITDLLQAVTGDDAPPCSSCEEGASASSRCRDCSEYLCDPCVKAHQRVRLTKDHRIIRFSGDAQNIPDSIISGGSLGSSSQASSSPGNATLNNYCDTHHEPHRLYCETCLAAVCTECTLIDHNSHQLAYLQDAIDGARNNTIKLNNETRAAIAAIREAIDNVQRMSEGVEIRSHQAAQDVRHFTKRCLAILEERERELLARIEQTRQMKGKALNAQLENLRLALTKLARTSDILNDALDTGVGIDMMMANEKAAAELKQVRSIRSELIPCEDDVITFVPREINILRSISTLGIVNTSVNSIGMHASHVKEIPPLLPFLPPVEFNGEPELQICGSGPRGRPILGASGLVVALDYSNNVPLIFGSEGEGDGQLCRPWGVCCDRNGQIIVADRSNNRIQVFHPNGKFSHKFGSQGTGPGQFDRPAGVAVDPLGRIVVADKDNHRIQILTIDGNFVLMFGEKGCRQGQFNYPWDVAVNSQGQICVSDTRNHRIQLFTNDGTFINKYGFEGSAHMWKHFDSPRGVCFTPTGHILITDFNNHRIVIIDHNFKNAQFLGSEGTGFKNFLRPQGIVCDDEGRIVVADSRNNRLQVYESNGTFLWKIGHAGKGPGELDRPSGVCINPEGHIIVVDFGNNRIQMF